MRSEPNRCQVQCFLQSDVFWTQYADRVALTPLYHFVGVAFHSTQYLESALRASHRNDRNERDRYERCREIVSSNSSRSHHGQASGIEGVTSNLCSWEKSSQGVLGLSVWRNLWWSSDSGWWVALECHVVFEAHKAYLKLLDPLFRLREGFQRDQPSKVRYQVVSLQGRPRRCAYPLAVKEMHCSCWPGLVSFPSRSHLPLPAIASTASTDLITHTACLPLKPSLHSPAIARQSLFPLRSFLSLALESPHRQSPAPAPSTDLSESETGELPPTALLSVVEDQSKAEAASHRNTDTSTLELIPASNVAAPPHHAHPSRA